MRLALLPLLGVFLACATPARAHQASESFLVAEQKAQAIAGRWSASVMDLEISVGLDANGDDAVHWSEVKAAEPRIRDLFLQKVTLRAGGRLLPVAAGEIELEQRSSGPCLALDWTAELPGAEDAMISSDFMFDYDSSHRVLCKVAANGTHSTTVLSRGAASIHLARPLPSPFLSFVRQGIIHILEGTDHLLFLLALLLPALFPRVAEGASLARGLGSVAKTVTAFTVAHSVTLVLASLGFARLPGVFTETAIAASVGLAAFNNLRPVWNDRAWPAAFGFGLIHGFGFASVLSDLQSGAALLVRDLFAFNLGVELGQLMVVLAFIPAALIIRRSFSLRRWVRVGGSLAVLLVAAAWVLERAFSLDIVPVLLIFG